MLVSAFKSWLIHATDSRLPLMVHMGTLITVPLKPDFDGEFLISFAHDNALNPGVYSSSYIILHPHLVEKLKITVSDQVTGTHLL